MVPRGVPVREAVPLELLRGGALGFVPVSRRRFDLCLTLRVRVRSRAPIR